MSLMKDQWLLWRHLKQGVNHPCFKRKNNTERVLQILQFLQCLPLFAMYIVMPHTVLGILNFRDIGHR